MAATRKSRAQAVTRGRRRAIPGRRRLRAMTGKGHPAAAELLRYGKQYFHKALALFFKGKAHPFGCMDQY